MTYSAMRAVAVAGPRPPGSPARALPTHTAGFVVMRSSGPVWIRFGTADVGAVARDGNSLLFPGGESVVLVPGAATHFRIRAEFYRVSVQLEGFGAAPQPPEPEPEPGMRWTPNSPTSLPIVPGGAGFAMYQDACFGRDQASGGLARAWKNIAVTNLNLSGPGSFRDAVLASGPRVVTFWVSGLIDYHDAPDDDRDIKIVSGDLYVAGESAPYPGIVLYGAQLIVDVNLARNVVFSHFANFQFPYIDKKKQDSRGDCFDVYVDDGVTSAPGGNLLHSGMCYAWGNDELASVYDGCEDFSFYQSVFSEALNNTDNLEGEPHGFGPYVNVATLRKARGDFTRCVFMHTKERNPATCVPLFSVVNCLDYDCFNRGVMICNQFGVDTQTNVEGNLFLDGPSGNNDAIFIQNSGGNEVSDASRYYVAENRGIGYDDSSQGDLMSSTSGPGQLVSSRITAAFPPGLVVTKIGEAREEFARLVARHAGPWPASRQAVIARFMAHIEARLTGIGDQGGMVDYPEDVGGMPDLECNTVDHTRGEDPMPGVTSSETQTVGTAAREIQPSSYTAFEEWLDRKRAAIMPADAVRIDEDSYEERRPRRRWRRHDRDARRRVWA